MLSQEDKDLLEAWAAREGLLSHPDAPPLYHDTHSVLLDLDFAPHGN